MKVPELSQVERRENINQVEKKAQKQNSSKYYYWVSKHCQGKYLELNLLSNPAHH